MLLGIVRPLVNPLGDGSFSASMYHGGKMVYSHFRNCAPPLDEKGGIIMEKVFPVFSERVFRACFGLVI